MLESIKRYNVCLNPVKCSFGVQSGKFLGFILSEGGLRWTLTNSRLSPTWGIPLASMRFNNRVFSRPNSFSSFVCDKAFHFFATLKKREMFEWSSGCDKVFIKLEIFLAIAHTSAQKQAHPTICTCQTLIRWWASCSSIRTKVNNQSISIARY